MAIFLDFKRKKELFNNNLNDNTKLLLNILNYSEKDLDDGYIISKVREFEKIVSKGVVVKPLSESETLFLRRYMFNDKKANINVPVGSITYIKINIESKLKNHFDKLNEVKNRVKSKINSLDLILIQDSKVHEIWLKNDIESCKDMLFFTEKEIKDPSLFLEEDKKVLNITLDKIRKTGLINNKLYLDDIIEEMTKFEIRRLENNLKINKGIAEKLNNIGYTNDNISLISDKELEELNLHSDTIDKIRSIVKKKKNQNKNYVQKHNLTDEELRIRMKLLEKYVRRSDKDIDSVINITEKNIEDINIILKYNRVLFNNHLGMMSIVTKKELRKRLDNEFTSEEKIKLLRLATENNINSLEEIFDIKYINIDECDYIRLHNLIKTEKEKLGKSSLQISKEIYNTPNNHIIDRIINNTVRYNKETYITLLKYFNIENIDKLLNNIGYDKKGYMCVLTDKKTKEVYKYVIGNISQKYIDDEEFTKENKKENEDMTVKGQKRTVIDEELKNNILEEYKNGKQVSDLSLKYNIKRNTIYKWVRYIEQNKVNIKTKGVKVVRAVKNKELKEELMKNYIDGDRSKSLFEISNLTGYAFTTLQNEFYGRNKNVSTNEKKETLVAATPIVKEELKVNGSDYSDEERELILLKRLNQSLQQEANNLDAEEKELNEEIINLEKQLEALNKKRSEISDEYYNVTQKIDANKERIKSLLA